MCSTSFQNLGKLADVERVVADKNVVIVDILADKRLDLSRGISDNDLISIGNTELLLIVGIDVCVRLR